MIHSEKLLQGEMCTLTCSASGGTSVSLSCSATGQTGTNTLTVPKGSTISYSIPAYGSASSKSGTVTMDKNKTLTATYSSSSSYTNVQYNVPTLSSNGTIGGSSFAISPSKEPISGKQAWHAFDGIYGSKTGNEWQLNQYNDLPGWLIMYFPVAVSITSIRICNDNSGFKNGTVDYSSDNGSSWTTKKSWTNTNYTARSTWYISSIGTSTDSKYNYWRLYFPKSSWNGTAYRPQIQEILITAYYSSTTTTYSWSVSIS